MRTRSQDKSYQYIIRKKDEKVASPPSAVGVAPDGSTVSYGPTLVNGWDPETTSALTLYDYSSMTDELAYRRKIGFVDHLKRVTEVVPTTVDRVSTSTTRRIALSSATARTYVYTKERGERPSQSLYEYLRGSQNSIGHVITHNLDSLPSIDVTALVSQTATKAVAGLSQLQLAVSGWEAREVPSLFAAFKGRGALGKLLRREADGDSHFRQAFEKLLGRIASATNARDRRGLHAYLRRYLQRRKRNLRDNDNAVKELLAALAELQLLWEFGVAPTVQDVQAIMGEMKKGITGFPVKGKTFGSSSTSSAILGHQSASYQILTDLEKTREDAETHTVTCRIVPIAPKGVNKRMVKLNRKMASYLGANQLGNIWALVPMSFMYDWLVSVDAYLDVLFLNTNDYIDVRWAYSRKREAIFAASGKFVSNIIGLEKLGQPGVSLEVHDRVVARERASRYIREAMAAPTAISMLGRPRPSIKKTYLAALIAIGIFNVKK
jgi:hypothetical protein